ncbi:unnamed protein product [Ophioblennius macclurei]
MKHKKGKDVAVQGTNDSSVVSKVSAAAQGYFQDAFLRHFVCKAARRAPLINRGYYVRWRAVDHCLRTFLQITAECPRRQILSLGAGFDSLYFRLSADGSLNGAVVFEVDFPDVARRKCALIGANATLSGMLDVRLPSSPTGPAYVCSSHYHLLGVDLREECQAEQVLGEAGLDWAAPTLVLSEVVLTYMETQMSDAVISWAAKLLPQSLLVVYEQIRPHDPFGRVMQEHFRKLNSTLHALRQYPDAAAQRRRFLDKGWDQCECVDMNDFFMGLVPEGERGRVESLEPFDEFEEWHQKCSHYFILTASRGSMMQRALLPHTPASPGPCVDPSWRPPALSVHAVPVRLEGLGMASARLGAGRLLLTGGASRGGRGAAGTVLLRDGDGWRSVGVEPPADLGVRLYHTATALPGGGALVFGGRSSPLKPLGGLCRVTFDPESSETEVRVAPVASADDPPPPRWRHAAAVVTHGGRDFLFVFGGRSQKDATLGDFYFLDVDQQRWTQLPVEGATPEPRHSHSACSFGGGVVIFGGLGRRGAPLGDATLLKPTETGFCWEELDVRPRPVPRYSHRAHVMGGKLVMVGGVWLHADGVPGVAVIDLATGGSVEFNLDTTSVPWPLMLHSFCSEPTDSEEAELLLVGGGGNCFSFGTHLNPQPVCVDLRPALI